MSYPLTRRLGRPVFHFEEEAWTWTHVLVALVHDGGWARAAEVVDRAAAVSGPGPDEVARDALFAMRRRCRLEAAEDLNGWLEGEGLAAADLVEWARRQARAEAAASLSEDERDAASATADRAQRRHEIEVEVLISPSVGEAVRALVLRAAASHRDGADRAGEPDGADAAAALAVAVRAAVGDDLDMEQLTAAAADVLHADAARARGSAGAASPDRMARRAQAERLERTRIAYERVGLRSRDAAREALLCVRVDGAGLAQVASRAGVACELERSTLGDVPGALRPALVGAVAGEAIGPIETKPGVHDVLVVREREPPEDVAVERQRIAAEVADEQLHRYAAGRLSWHGHD